MYVTESAEEHLSIKIVNQSKKKMKSEETPGNSKDEKCEIASKEEDTSVKRKENVAIGADSTDDKIEVILRKSRSATYES